jgi:hypothetical protein
VDGSCCGLCFTYSHVLSEQANSGRRTHLRALQYESWVSTNPLFVSYSLKYYQTKAAIADFLWAASMYVTHANIQMIKALCYKPEGREF